jgi:hypothetical protein
MPCDTSEQNRIEVNITNLNTLAPRDNNVDSESENTILSAIRFTYHIVYYDRSLMLYLNICLFIKQCAIFRLKLLNFAKQSTPVTGFICLFTVVVCLYCYLFYS